MQSVSLFALNLLDELSRRFTDRERWEFVVTSLSKFGFNALNLASFSPESGVIHWARTSMSEDWLKIYSDGGYAEGDPILAQVTNGVESVYVNAESRAKASNLEIASKLFSGLGTAGYHHLFSLVVPCPNDEVKIVILSSDRPDAEQIMTEQAREMRILATVIATNLGSETEGVPSGIHDLGPLVASAPPLSQREKQVLLLLGDGLRNDQIAANLDIKEVTVRAHLKTAREKLNAPTREAALVRAVQMGLLRPAMTHHS